MNLTFSPLCRGFGRCCALVIACLLLANPALRAQSPADTLAWAKLYGQYAAHSYISADSSLWYAHKALLFARQTGYAKGIAKSYYALGSAHTYLLNEPASAIAYFDSATVWAAPLHIRRLTVALLMSTAEAHNQLARYPQATRELLQALAQIEQPPIDSQNLGPALDNLGMMVLNQGDVAGALRYRKQALKIAQQQQNVILEGNILGNMAACYTQMARYDSALIVLEMAATLNRENGIIPALIQNELNIGSTHNKDQQYPEARKHLLAALALLTEAPNTYTAVNCLTNLAYSYRSGQPGYQAGYPREGLVYAKQAERLLDSLPPGSWEWKRNLYKIMADLYDDAGDYQQASRSYILAYAAADSFFLTAQRDKVAMERENYEVTKRDSQISTLATQQAISTTQRNWGIAVAILFLGFAVFAFATARRLRTLNADLLATNATKDRIMSILSHDLRSPLSTLDSFLQLSREYDMPPAQRERAERQLSSQLQSTLVMLDNLLRWSLMQVKGKAAQPASIAVKETVEHAIEPLLGLAELKSLTLNTQLPENLVLHADRDMAVFMVRNLVANAIKFSPAGAEIKLQATQDNGLVTLTIQDHGPGMDAAKIATLFSMQANTSTTGTAKEKGTGIGLPLAADMARKNGGSLTVTSQPGTGSAFVLTLLAG